MKTKINFIIDVIMFVLMGLLAGLGLLIKYVLLPGSERWMKYESNVELSFWGLDRHQWGAIHLYIAIALVIMLVLHLIFHWKMIVSMCKKCIRIRKVRIIGGVLLPLVTLVLLTFPFFIEVEVNDMARGKERFEAASIVNLPKEKVRTEKISETVHKTTPETALHGTTESHDINEQLKDSIDVKGYFTLEYASKMYRVPCDVLKEGLNIPVSVSDASKLGHLRKRYNFTMTDVRMVIYEYSRK